MDNLVEREEVKVIIIQLGVLSSWSNKEERAVSKHFTFSWLLIYRHCRIGALQGSCVLFSYPQSVKSCGYGGGMASAAFNLAVIYLSIKPTLEHNRYDLSRTKAPFSTINYLGLHHVTESALKRKLYGVPCVITAWIATHVHIQEMCLAVHWLKNRRLIFVQAVLRTPSIRASDTGHAHSSISEFSVWVCMFTCAHVNEWMTEWTSEWTDEWMNELTKYLFEVTDARKIIDRKETTLWNGLGSVRLVVLARTCGVVRGWLMWHIIN